MKKIVAVFCLTLAIVLMGSFCVTSFAAEVSSEPLCYIEFDSDYYSNSIGNAYGFDSVEYISVGDSELVTGALRLKFEKSPYPHMGSYSKDGYRGEFDPFFCLPLYEIDEDILCDEVSAVVITVRVQDTSLHGDRAMMFFDNSENTVIDGDGDFTSAVASYKKTSEFQNIVFYTKGLAKWKGILQNLRIDPFNVPNDKMDYFDIAGVAFFADNKSAMKFDGDYVNLSEGNNRSAIVAENGLIISFFCSVIGAMGFSGLLSGKNKKAIAVALVLLVVVCSFGACKKTENNDVTPSGTEVPTAEPTPAPDNFVESRENSEYRYDVYERHVEITKYIGMKPEVSVPDTIDGLPVTVIGYKAFFRYYCHDDKDPRHELGLERLTLPDTIEVIEDYGLAGLEECDSITFGKGLKKIGDNALQNAFALKELTFKGNNLESIGAWAFSSCFSLKNVDIPSSVKEVGPAAFMWCRSLDTLEFGQGVKVGKGVQFGSTPLKNCINLDKWLGK